MSQLPPPWNFWLKRSGWRGLSSLAASWRMERGSEEGLSKPRGSRRKEAQTSKKSEPLYVVSYSFERPTEECVSPNEPKGGRRRAAPAAGGRAACHLARSQAKACIHGPLPSPVSMFELVSVEMNSYPVGALCVAY